MTVSQARVDAVLALLVPKATAADLARAEQGALALAREAPDRGDLKALVGITLAAVQKYEQAIPWLEQAPPESRTSLTFGGAYALSLMRAGRLADARQVFLQAPMAWREAGGPLVPAGAWSFVGLHVEYAVRSGDFDLAEMLCLKLLESIHAARRDAQRQQPDTSPPPVRLPARKVLPLLYLPVEVKAREFDSRLLIAAHAAAEGLSSVIGATWNVRKFGFADLPPGIVLSKTFSRFDLSANRKAIKAGHVTAGIDEEAFGRSDADGFTLLNVHRDALAVTDRIFVQGDRQHAAWTRLFPQAADRMTVTGNPRADLIALDRAVRRPPRHGHVLICLMSGNVNSRDMNVATVLSQFFQAAAPNFGGPDGEVAVRALRDSLRFEIASLRQMQHVIRALADRVPDRKIIVRPHPVENPSIWRSVAAGLANVVVENDGPILAAFADAAVVVFQAGCTTGLEAALAGIPIVRFAGDGHVIDPDLGFSSRLGPPARTPDDVARLVAAALEGGAASPTDGAVIAENLSGAGAPIASRAIAGALGRLYQAHGGGGRVEPAALTGFNARRREPFEPSFLHLGKFPATTEADAADRLAAVCGAAGIAAVPKLTAVDWNTYLVSAAS